MKIVTTSDIFLYLLCDISRIKYMFTMYIYVTGVLDKVPKTTFTKLKRNNKKERNLKVEDHHTRWPGPTFSLLHEEEPPPSVRGLNCSVLVVGQFGTIRVTKSQRG